MDKGNIKEKILDLLFPKKCVCCGKMGSFLCGICKKEITKVKSGSCPNCNRLSKKGKFCQTCRPKTSLTGVLFCLYFSEEKTKKLLHEFKYGGIYGISEILGNMMAEKIIEENLSVDLITFVPISKKRQRKRGFNQTQLLAKEISDKTGIKMLPLVKKIKETKSQVGLKKKERQSNLGGAFIGLEQSLRGKKILLVDDVYTTGTTMLECGKALRSMGAKEVWGITAAKE